MQEVRDWYIRECGRQRVDVHESFIAGAERGELCADLTGVPTASVKLFATALQRWGDCALAATPNNGGVAQKKNAEKKKRVPLRHVRLHWGPPASSYSAAAAYSRKGRGSSTTSPRLPSTSKGGRSFSMQSHRTNTSLSGRQRSLSTNSTAISHSPLMPTSPQSDLCHRSTNGNDRGSGAVDLAVLQLLLEGIRNALLRSVESVERVELIAFPFDTAAEKSARVLHAIAMCSRLTVLRLDHCRLTPANLTTLTATSRAFGQLEEASLAHCGLSDRCQRAIVSFLKLHRDYEGEAAWSRSVRDGDPELAAAMQSTSSQSMARTWGSNHSPSRGATGPPGGSTVSLSPSPRHYHSNSGSLAGTRTVSSLTKQVQPPPPPPQQQQQQQHQQVRGLRLLDLSSNELGDATLLTIASALKQTGNTALQFLDLRHNRITSAGLQRLLLSEVLETSALQCLDLSGNPAHMEAPAGHPRHPPHEGENSDEDGDEGEDETTAHRTGDGHRRRDDSIHVTPPASVTACFDCVTSRGQLVFNARSSVMFPPSPAPAPAPPPTGTGSANALAAGAGGNTNNSYLPGSGAHAPSRVYNGIVVTSQQPQQHRRGGTKIRHDDSLSSSQPLSSTINTVHFGGPESSAETTTELLGATTKSRERGGQKESFILYTSTAAAEHPGGTAERSSTLASAHPTSVIVGSPVTNPGSLSSGVCHYNALQGSSLSTPQLIEVMGELEQDLRGVGSGGDTTIRSTRPPSSPYAFPDPRESSALLFPLTTSADGDVVVPWKEPQTDHPNAVKKGAAPPSRSRQAGHEVERRIRATNNASSASTVFGVGGNNRAGTKPKPLITHWQAAQHRLKQQQGHHQHQQQQQQRSPTMNATPSTDSCRHHSSHRSSTEWKLDSSMPSFKTPTTRKNTLPTAELDYEEEEEEGGGRGRGAGGDHCNDGRSSLAARDSHHHHHHHHHRGGAAGVAVDGHGKSVPARRHAAPSPQMTRFVFSQSSASPQQALLLRRRGRQQPQPQQQQQRRGREVGIGVRGAPATTGMMTAGRPVVSVAGGGGTIHSRPPVNTVNPVRRCVPLSNNEYPIYDAYYNDVDEQQQQQQGQLYDAAGNPIVSSSKRLQRAEHHMGSSGPRGGYPTHSREASYVDPTPPPVQRSPLPLRGPVPFMEGLYVSHVRPRPHIQERPDTHRESHHQHENRRRRHNITNSRSSSSSTSTSTSRHHHHHHRSRKQCRRSKSLERGGRRRRDYRHGRPTYPKGDRHHEEVTEWGGSSTQSYTTSSTRSASASSCGNSTVCSGSSSASSAGHHRHCLLHTSDTHYRHHRRGSRCRSKSSSSRNSAEAAAAGAAATSSSSLSGEIAVMPRHHREARGVRSSASTAPETLPPPPITEEATDCRHSATALLLEEQERENEGRRRRRNQKQKKTSVSVSKQEGGGDKHTTGQERRNKSKERGRRRRSEGGEKSWNEEDRRVNKKASRSRFTSQTHSQRRYMIQSTSSSSSSFSRSPSIASTTTSRTNISRVSSATVRRSSFHSVRRNHDRRSRHHRRTPHQSTHSRRRRRRRGRRHDHHDHHDRRHRSDTIGTGHARAQSDEKKGEVALTATGTSNAKGDTATSNNNNNNNNSLIDPVFHEMEEEERRLEEEERVRQSEQKHWWNEHIPVAIRELIASTADDPQVISTPFLTALTGRFENHELEVTERIAQQQQSTTGRLEAMETALMARVMALEAQLRETQSAARQAEDALLLKEATEKANAMAEAVTQADAGGVTASSRLTSVKTTFDTAKDEVEAENVLRAQLVDLIHVGLSRLQDKIFMSPTSPVSHSNINIKNNNNNNNTMTSTVSAAGAGTSTGGGSVLAKYSTVKGSLLTMDELRAEKNDQQQFLEAVHHRLETMGW